MTEEKSVIVVHREKDDPICNRISAGGELGGSLYLVYRGHPAEVKKILKELLDAVEQQDDAFLGMIADQKYTYPRELGK